MPGKLDRSIVQHVSRKLSQYIWHALQNGAFITAEVKDKHPQRSPLTQGGLEIIIEMSIVWDDAVKKKKRKTRNYSNMGLYRPKQQNSGRN